MANKTTSFQLRPGEMSQQKLGVLLVLPSAILLTLLIVVPVIITMHASFYHVNTATREYRFVGLENYRFLLTGGGLFLESFWRTILWTGGNIILQTVLGLAIALVLQSKVSGRAAVRGIALFPYVVPAVIAALAWRFALNDAVGIINYLMIQAGLIERPIIWLGNPDTALWSAIAINAWKYTPFMMVIFLARLQVIPLALYDAARIDGANLWQEFIHVTLPWLWSVILTVVLLRIIWTSTEFDLIYLLAYGGPLNSTTTLPVLIRNIAIDQADAGQASAVAIGLAALLIVTSLLFFRLIRKAGVSLGE
jgi:multiple sugar transport system permease protein